jgi:NADPH:quinone reductase-like Zn-dependent oxidoreductase
MAAIASRTVRFHEHGEPLDVLRDELTEIPDPPPGMIRIRVAAAGLNPADWQVCRGFRSGLLPRGIGFDVAGTVESCGDGVADVQPGDLVLGIPDVMGQTSGGAADVAILQEWTPVPTGLGAVHAAVLPMVVRTAAWTLGALEIGPGQTVFIHGGGSMVGYAMVQVARDLGARVITSAGPTYATDLTAFGATVTSYGDGMAARVRDLAGGNIDVTIDAAPPAPGTIAELIAIAGGADRVVTISNHDEARALGARVNLDLLTPQTMTPARLLLPDFAARAAAGTFRLPIARLFTLDDWRDATQLSLSGTPHGKVVLIP